MSMTAQAVKKFINDPEEVVPEALAGIAAAHPGLVRVDAEQQLIMRAEAPVRGKVGLVSGGGSGHEPLHGGFVGLGMLDAACAGAVFTSPVPDQMAAATRAVDGGAGVLHIVKNYTGDVLNFQMAAELAEDEASRSPRSCWTTTWPCRTRSTRPAAAVPARPCWAEKIAGLAPRPAARWPRWRTRRPR